MLDTLDSAILMVSALRIARRKRFPWAQKWIEAFQTDAYTLITYIYD